MSSRRRNSEDRPVKVNVVVGLTLIAIVINIVTLTLGVVSFINLGSGNTLQSEHKGKQAEPAVIACIRCPADQQVDHLTRRLQSRTENGQQFCCAQTSEQMSVLFEVVMTKTTQKRESSPSDWTIEEIQNFSLSMASAHKRLLPSVSFTGDAPLFTNEMVPLLLNTTHHDELVEHTRGVQVRESGFQIIHEGLYQIYSSVRFKPDSSQPCKNYKFKTWEQVVTRMSARSKEEENILSSVYTCCDECIHVKKTSYAGGAFYLKTNDTLRVLVSGSGLVNYKQDSSFFGLVKLDSSVTQDKNGQ